MSYLNDTLEPGDLYRNRYCGVKLPHDKELKDPDKLAELSGPCITVVPAREEVTTR